jgi:hypothetical protein
MTPALAEALRHIDRGFAVMPVHGKKPASELIRVTRGRRGWGQLARRPADKDEVRAWLERDPEVGVAILTGEVSRLTVLDDDGSEEFPFLDLPTTATSSTPHGRHTYLRSSGPVRTVSFPWGEFRGDGAYVVAPLSPGYDWLLTPEEAGIVDASCVLPQLEHALLPTPIRTTSNRDSRTDAFVPTALPSWLARLDVDDKSAGRLAVALGLPEGLRLGQRFLCLLHPDRDPSAALWRAHASSSVLYHDFHRRGRVDEWLPLAAVRARKAGRLDLSGGPELAVWKLRLCFEAGYLEPIWLDLPDVEAGLEPLWSGLRLLLGLRWRISPGSPTPFSAGFAAAWCGVSKRQAHEGTRELVRRGLLRLHGHDVNRTRLWLPEGVRPAT